MLTPKELDELYGEINTPYSDEEFDKHSENRLIKSWLEITHAHNFDLINLTKQWNDYFFNGGEKPARKLWVMLRPGKNNDNAACARLHDMANYFAQFEHGSVPRLPIIVYVSRSSLTLISRLEDFFYSPHLLEANNHIKNFFCLLAYDGEPQMTKEEFRKALFDEIDGFISECSKHADALGDYIFDRLDELRKGEKLIKVQVVKQATNAHTRGRVYGDRNPLLRDARNSVITEIRRRKETSKLSWDKIVMQMRTNSAYTSRMKGVSDSSWISYAKNKHRFPCRNT